MKDFETLKEFINEVYDDGFMDGTVDTLNTVGDLYREASDIIMDVLEDAGLTVSEKLFAIHILELHSEIMNDMVTEEFEIEECDGDCCADCDLCCESVED